MHLLYYQTAKLQTSSNNVPFTVFAWLCPNIHVNVCVGWWVAGLPTIQPWMALPLAFSRSVYQQRPYIYLNLFALLVMEMLLCGLPGIMKRDINIIIHITIPITISIIIITAAAAIVMLVKTGATDEILHN